MIPRRRNTQMSKKYVPHPKKKPTPPPIIPGSVEAHQAALKVNRYMHAAALGLRGWVPGQIVEDKIYAAAVKAAGAVQLR